MQASKVKKINKQTKNVPTISFGGETNKNSTQKEYIYNMVSHTDNNIEYTYMEAKIVSIMINGINIQDKVKRSSFMEKLSLKQGIKILVRKDMKQDMVKFYSSIK